MSRLSPGWTVFLTLVPLVGVVTWLSRPQLRLYAFERAQQAAQRARVVTFTPELSLPQEMAYSVGQSYRIEKTPQRYYAARIRAKNTYALRIMQPGQVSLWDEPRDVHFEIGLTERPAPSQPDARYPRCERLQDKTTTDTLQESVISGYYQTRAKGGDCLSGTRRVSYYRLLHRTPPVWLECWGKTDWPTLLDEVRAVCRNIRVTGPLPPAGRMNAATLPP